jgi:hypothetical protein
MKDSTRYRFRLLGMVAILIATFGLEGAAQAPQAPNAASQKTGSNASKPGAAVQSPAAPNTALQKTVNNATRPAPTAQTQSQSKLTPSPSKIDGATTFVLDPACNACTGASMKVSLRYEQLATGQGANAGKPIHLDLRVDPLKSDDKTANARVSVEGEHGKRALPAEIKPGDSINFQVKVMGVLAPGNWKTMVHNGEENLGEVTFTLPAVSLNLKVDWADANAPAIILTRGEQTVVYLKNDDAVGYGIKWDFQLESEKTEGEKKDKDTKGSGDVSTLPESGKKEPEGKEEKISGGGSAPLKILPKEEWFGEANTPACSWLGAHVESWVRIPCNWRAIFKDKTANGLLTVRLASPDCADDAGAPVKLIHVKTTLAYYGPNKKALWSYLVTLILLLAGAVLSLYINYKFPDEQIRRELRQQLKEIGAGIGDLSMKLASRLRVLVGMELRLIEIRLRELNWYGTDFEAQRSQIADCSARLKRRVDILKKMSRAREDYEHLATLEVPPAVMEKLEDGFEVLGKMLDDFQVSDADLLDAEAKLAEMRKLLSGWQQPDTATAAELAASLKSLYDDLQPPNTAVPPAGAPQPQDKGGALFRSETLGALRVALEDPTNPKPALKYKALATLAADLEMQPPDSSALVGTEYYRNAVLAFRGEVLRKYVLLCDMRAPGADSALQTRRSELFGLLTHESWYALRKARRLVWEMAEDIYSDDIKKEIEARRVEIGLDRNVLRAFEPALFNVRFLAPKFDACSARDEWRCTWSFGHAPFESQPQIVDQGKAKPEQVAPDVRNDKDATKDNYLEEQGWSVAHYFPGAKKYKLTVRFRHEESGDLKSMDAAPIGKSIDVGAPRDQNNASWHTKVDKNAVLRLLLGLIPAVLGMLAGAKDEFLKMDLFLALGAIFLAGFGSDTVKNLLSQKTTKT